MKRAQSPLVGDAPRRRCVTVNCAALQETLLESELFGHDLLREMERRHVLAMLRQEKGNKVRAAKALGISRRASYRLIARYHFSDEDCRGDQRGA